MAREGTDCSERIRLSKAIWEIILALPWFGGSLRYCWFLEIKGVVSAVVARHERIVRLRSALDRGSTWPATYALGPEQFWVKIELGAPTLQKITKSSDILAKPTKHEKRAILRPGGSFTNEPS